MPRPMSLQAALWLLSILSSRVGSSETHRRRVLFMSEQGFYDLARDSLSDQAASSCVLQLLEDADVGVADGLQRADDC